MVDVQLIEYQIMQDKKVQAVIKWLLITAAGLVLYKLGAAAALTQRGYLDYGGECLLLLLPIIWWVAERTIKDISHELKQIKMEVMKDE